MVTTEKRWPNTDPQAARHPGLENLVWSGGRFHLPSALHPLNWRWQDHFGGGQLMDWVGHHVDIALWTSGSTGRGR